MKLRDDERRDFMRLATVAEAGITRLATGQALSAQLINLSASGCAFLTEIPIKPDESVEFVVQGASERIRPLKRMARVVRLTHADAQYLVAVEFLTDTD